MKTYFVTGATGAIGSALVPLLLEDATTEVRLLLRAPTAEALALRLENLFAFWRIDASDEAIRSRVKVFRGDATLPQFALADDAYRALSAECTHVIHAAGNVRMNLPLAQARHSSVDSALNIIAFARACAQLVKVEFVSTVGVGGKLAGAVPEEWITTQRDFHNTYEEAKADAEGNIRAALEGGLPLTVHRPSMVVGDAVSGRIIHFQIFYHLCEFLSGRRTAGLSPRLGPTRLDIIPSDYVARIIAWSSVNTLSTGRILHSCSGPRHALPLAQLRDTVRLAFARAGRNLPRIVTLRPAAFLTLLRAASLFLPSGTRRAMKTLPVFLDYLATEQIFANDATQALLAPAGLALPESASYLDRVLAYYLDQ